MTRPLFAACALAVTCWSGSAFAQTADECREAAERSEQVRLIEDEGYVVTVYVLDPNAAKDQDLLREQAARPGTTIGHLGACGTTALQIYVVARRPLSGRVETTDEPPVAPDPDPPPGPIDPPGRIDLACRGTYTECYGHQRPPLPGRTSRSGEPGRPDGVPPDRGAPTPGDPVRPARPERVCNLRQLAALVVQRYGTGLPIARVPILNAQRPTYLLLLSGMQFELGQATNLPDALIALENISALDLYRAGVMDAVQGLPANASLILAGHSMGGMEAQNLVESLVHRWGFHVAHVVSFGAPITAARETTTGYLHVRTRDEPLQALDRQYNLGADPTNRLVRANPGEGFPLTAPNGSHFVYDKPRSGLDRHPVPTTSLLAESRSITPVGTLREPCYEIDMGALVAFPAHDLLTRLLNPPPPSRLFAPAPRNADFPNDVIPGACTPNQCWPSAKAVDGYWNTGRWTEPPPRRGIPYVEELYGARTLPAQVRIDLRQQHGGAKALDPGIPGGRALHAEGIQVTVRSQAEVVGLMRDRLGPGAQGYVFVIKDYWLNETTGETRPIQHTVSGAGWTRQQSSHVFNVRTLSDGRVELFDRSARGAPPSSEWTTAVRILFFRTR